MKVVTPVQAHSNEEYYAPKEIYIARNLPFFSEAANTFMRKLDQVICDSNKDNGGKNQQCNVRIKNPPNTMFTKAPKGLLLDFYDKVWYNSKLPEQRKNIADWKCVAFLEDLTSLCEFTTEDEKLGDKRFNDKHFDYGESIELEIDNEDETQDQDDEDDITTRKKGGKGKEREIEVDDDIEIELEDQDMEIDATHNSNFIGGLTEEEWNAWQ
ncbi:hypothetical protein O181_008160 [Austropuccinia psidii MF-1]|uniref:Uncharacterized protein n=1 Tax=Austropuccinia psidii MF-1 TaxID=1389203 RepID=A0A9Q3GIM2_9BASI|nr:hypothetical protein [Austropuccinia psidii MF-1]